MFQYRQMAPVTFGPGAIATLGEKAKELGLKKVIVIFDKGIEAAGITEKAFESLKKAGVDYVGFDGVVADPPIEVVQAAGELARAEKVDGFVGLGGGSSMDATKACAIMCQYGGDAKDYIFEAPHYFDTKASKIILCPTTAGTGSEVTHVAVITNKAANQKWSVFCDPTWAIVDPELTFTLPPDETVSTGLDAFAHAAEALTCNISHPHSDIMALEALDRIGKYLEVAWNEPTNLEARSEMAFAASLAGTAFDNTMTHLGHSIGDALGCRYHFSHGYSCTLGLPVTMEICGPAVPEKMAKVCKALNVELKGNETGEELGRLAADAICAMMRRMKLKSLKDQGCKREDVIALADQVERNHISSFCPVKITLDVAEKVLGRMYDIYQ